ncbi:MAG: hypothetical protein V4850_35700 [Myxococcota bacterium]
MGKAWRLAGVLSLGMAASAPAVAARATRHVSALDASVEEPRVGHDGYVSGIDAGTGWVITAGQDGTLRVWSRRGLVRVIAGDNGPIRAVRVSPDGKRVAACDGTHVRVWEPRTGALVSAWEWGADPSSGRGCKALAWSPDGERIAVAAAALRVFDRAGAVVWEIVPPEYRGVADVDWNGARLAYAITDGSIELADSDTGAILGRIEPSGRTGLRSVRISPDGREVAAAYLNAAEGQGGEAVVWGLDTAVPKQVFRPGKGSVLGVSWGKHRTALTIVHEQGATVIDATTGAVLRGLNAENVTRLMDGVGEGPRVWMTTMSGTVFAWGRGGEVPLWLWRGQRG